VTAVSRAVVRTIRPLALASVLAVALAGCADSGAQGGGGTNESATESSSATTSPATPSDLVLRDGDKVSVQDAHVVAVPGRPVRLCAPLAIAAPGYGPGGEPAPQYCDVGIDVSGVDLDSLVQRREKEGAVEGYADVRGTYRADAVTVNEQTAATQPAPTGLLPDRPPCPPPSGGWPLGAADRNLDTDAADEYMAAHPGAVMQIAILRPSDTQAVMYLLTAVDPAPVRTALAASYPNDLCAAQSRWTPSQVKTARSHIEHLALPTGGPIYEWGEQLTPDGDVVVDVHLARVTDDVVAALADDPPGLIALNPWLKPAG
jgi:hypothetical protein